MYTENLSKENKGGVGTGARRRRERRKKETRKRKRKEDSVPLHEGNDLQGSVGQHLSHTGLLLDTCQSTTLPNLTGIRKGVTNTIPICK